MSRISRFLNGFWVAFGSMLIPGYFVQPDGWNRLIFAAVFASIAGIIVGVFTAITLKWFENP